MHQKIKLSIKKIVRIKDNKISKRKKTPLIFKKNEAKKPVCKNKISSWINDKGWVAHKTIGLGMIQCNSSFLLMHMMETIKEIH